jgi:hypothetical protein
VQRTGDHWTLTRPVALPADAETIDDFLAKLQSQRVKDFVAEAPASLAPYGLDHPTRVAIETGRDKDRSTKELLFGRVDKARQGVYAMRPGESSVLLLPEAAWTAVPKNVAALRDKVVVAFDRDKVTRIDLESPKGKVTLTRAGTRWGITAPEPLPADQVEAGALLFTLKELRAQGFLSDDASGIPRYLARPTVRITLTQEGAKRPTMLLLAPSHDRRGGAPSAYAALAGRGPVVLVEAKKLADLTRSATELRDRTFIPGFEPRTVGRLRLSAGGTTVTLQRKGEGEWTFVEGATGAAKGVAVENLLFTLRGLKWRSIAAPGSDEAPRYGLDAPTFTAAMLRADGGEIATVLVGRREGDVVYAKLGALPAIYAVDAKALGDLPKLPDGLKG